MSKADRIGKKPRPERYETVRAFGLSVYVASLSSVSRYLCNELSHAGDTAVNRNRCRLLIDLTAKHFSPDYSLLSPVNHLTVEMC